MLNTSETVSHAIFLYGTFSTEEILRALIVSDQVHLLGTRLRINDKEQDKIFQTCIDRRRLTLIDEKTSKLWRQRIQQQGLVHRNWWFYYASAICKAFAESSVTHRIVSGLESRDVGDNGGGLYPAELFPTGTIIEPISDPLPWRESFDAAIRFLEDHNNFKATKYEARYAAEWAFLYADEKMLLDNFMNDVVSTYPAYSQFILLAENRYQLKWVRGIMNMGIEFNAHSSEDLSSIIEVSLGKPTLKQKLENIPIDRLLAICEGLSQSRRRFTSQTLKWLLMLAGIENCDERAQTLKQIRTSEIIPSMIDFNEESQKLVAPILKSISGDQFGKIALGAFAAALCYFAGAPPEYIPIAGAAGGALGAAINVAKDIIVEETEARTKWVAFVSALSDELDKWNSRKK